MLVLDDVGWADVSYHGSDFPTPVIDRLATEEGVRLDNFYVQSTCSPSRSALMSGRHPFHTGMQHFFTLVPGTAAALPLEQPTIAEVLKESGYSTHAIGKWHLGAARWSNTPTERGFDTFLGYMQGEADYYNKTVGAIGDRTGGGPLQVISETLTGFDFWENKRVMWEEMGTEPTSRYTMDIYEEEHKRILDNHDSSKPFFIYYSHQMLHKPLQYPPESEFSDNCNHVAHTGADSGHDRHTLCAMMSRLDASIGRFETVLKEKGMWDNTVVWVVSDNGGMMPQGGSASSNFPLRSGKTSLFQGGVKVVSFVTGGFVPESARSTTETGLMFHVDAPTTLAALGRARSLGDDGFDVWDAVISGAASPRQEVPLAVDFSLFTELAGKVMGSCCGGVGHLNALIQGKWKLISGRSGSQDGYTSIAPYEVTPTDSEDYVMSRGQKVWLFDIDADPEERHNVAKENQDVVHAMQHRLRELGDKSNGYLDPQPNWLQLRSLPSLHNGSWAPFLNDDEVLAESDFEGVIV